MGSPVQDEFEIDAFARYYESLSDSFIDIGGAARSLIARLREGERVFEIGLGTGYFAEQLRKAGWPVSGIQPADKMLALLKRKRPDIPVVEEQRIEEYLFSAPQDVIVSHSSVFGFTRFEAAAGSHGESGSSLVFQSFIREKLRVFANLAKVLDALSPTGRFFVNVQTNPLPITEVGPPEDPFVYEMTRCSYHLDLERVEKTFRTTYRSQTEILDAIYYCQRYSDFKRCIEGIGGRVTLTDDERWGVLERA
jgi:SAM-dependent methyltransferase